VVLPLTNFVQHSQVITKFPINKHLHKTKLDRHFLQDCKVVQGFEAFYQSTEEFKDKTLNELSKENKFDSNNLD
jgi:hypothetical protein